MPSIGAKMRKNARRMFGQASRWALLLSPEPVGWFWHHQLYSGRGADIVMESISLIYSGLASSTTTPCSRTTILETFVPSFTNSNVRSRSAAKKTFSDSGCSKKLLVRTWRLRPSGDGFRHVSLGESSSYSLSGSLSNISFPTPLPFPSDLRN